MSYTQISLTPTAYAILALLRQRPLHGYEIARYFRPERELGQAAPTDMSTIYTYLKDLQEHGLITGQKVAFGARPPRTVFSLTPEAEALVMEWLRRPVARMREVRLDFIMKLYFARSMAPDYARTLVEAQIAACHRYLERLSPGLQSLDSASFDYLVLESKITAAEGVIKWLENILHRETV